MPKPIVVNLADAAGFELRCKAAEFIEANRNITGAERGSTEEQGFGALAEIVVRTRLGLPEINPEDHPIGYDLLLKSGIKVDVKCRGGALPFQETYEADDGIPREAKHNFFARQLYDEDLDADIYVMAHLETPTKRTLPGTKRQKKWKLYVCGWVSKDRVLREGVYMPRGSLTERGRSWFAYRGQEIEFYHHNLNELKTIESLQEISRDAFEADKVRTGDLNLTSVDAVRIGHDLIGRGILTPDHLKQLQAEIRIEKLVKPVLHANQYLHLLNWLARKGVISDEHIQRAKGVLKEERFEGL